MSGTQQKPSQSGKDPSESGMTDGGSVVPIRDLDPLESTMPPTPLRDLLAADGASVFVLTDDAALLDIVQEAGGEQYPVFPAPSWQALREAIVERRCGIALLDIDAVKGALTDRLDELAKLSAHLVPLVASPRDRADGLLNLLSERKIHRLLIKPPTVGITRLLLESSVNRHIEMKRRAEAQPAAAVQQQSRRLAGWRSWATAGLLVTGVIGAVTVTSVLNPSEGPAVVSEESPAAVARILPNASQQEAVPARTLPASVNTAGPANPAPEAGAADAPTTTTAVAASAGVETFEGPTSIALGNGTPVSDSMIEGAQEAVPVPQGPSLEALESRYAAVETALLAEDLDGAEALLSELATLDPESSRMTFLTNQLERARSLAAEVAAAEEAAALAAEAAAAPSELVSFVGLSRSRLSQGQVTGPAGDSALDYYDRAAGIDPTAPEVAELASVLGSAVLTAAEQELAAGRFAAAESLFVRARDLGVADADISALELSLALARESLAQEEQSALIAEADELLARGQAFEPAGENALERVLEVQRLNPAHPAVADAFLRVQQVLEPLAADALDASDWDRAAAVINGLERAQAPAEIISALREALSFGERQADYLATPAPASELSVLELVPPIYPNRAITRNIEGWVDLEFIVDTAGIPRDIVVVGAEPADLFEEAAVTAAEAYVFVPFELDGRVYERLVELRIRFALQ